MNGSPVDKQLIIISEEHSDKNENLDH